MKRSAAPLLIVAFFVLAVGIFWIFRKENKEVAARVNAPAVTVSPIPTAMAAPVPTATPEPTATAAPTEVPTPEPTVTPAPTPSPSPTVSPSPIPYIQCEMTGELVSDTETMLNLLVKWGIFRDEQGGYKLQLDAYVRSYTLYTGQRTDDLVFAVGDKVAYGSSPAIQLETNALTETPVGSATIEVPTGQTVKVAVDWYFNGSYSNKELGKITASGNIQIPY